MSYRIAVGGFVHETNSFNHNPTTQEHFEQSDCWPGMTTGSAMLDTFTDQNLAISGFLQASAQDNVDICPIFWCSAPPKGLVNHEAYKSITDAFCYKLEHQLPVDAVFLDLHGAMIAENIFDADGEFIANVRRLVGPEIPIVCSLDFHANVTKQMFNQATMLIPYRLYPHSDMYETGDRCYKAVLRLLQEPHHYHSKAFKKIPRLISLPWQCTELEPNASLIKFIQDEEIMHDMHLCFTPGFPLSDIDELGISIWGYGAESELVAEVVQKIAHRVLENFEQYKGTIYSIEDAVVYCKSKKNSKPIILVDSQDNPGGGSDGDSIAIIHQLQQNKVKKALVGVIIDPSACQEVHRKKAGDTIKLDLGKNITIANPEPLHANFKIKALKHEPCLATTGYYQGCQLDLGLCALLQLDNIDIVIASKSVQAADPSLFTQFDLKLDQYKIIVLKSTAHFRAAFKQYSNDVLIVEGPGTNYLDFTKLNYQKFSRGKN